MFKKNKTEAGESEAERGVGRGRFTSQNGVVSERSKKIKKIIDDLVAILNLTQTSADASRYLMYGKGGWPH